MTADLKQEAMHYVLTNSADSLRRAGGMLTLLIVSLWLRKNYYSMLPFLPIFTLAQATPTPAPAPTPPLEILLRYVKGVGFSFLPTLSTSLSSRLKGVAPPSQRTYCL
jgi:hypothetical protein